MYIDIYISAQSGIYNNCVGASSVVVQLGEIYKKWCFNYLGCILWSRRCYPFYEGGVTDVG